MNGVFRVSHPPTEAMPSLDGRQLGDRTSLLAALGRALDFPEYYGGNWDALDECLNDLSWHPGALKLLLTHTDALPADLLASLEDVFADAAIAWQGKREFALYLL